MALGAILAIGGAIAGAFGKKKAGDAAKEAAFLNAQLIEKRTEIDATVAERTGEKGIGQTKADIGAAGLQIAGSAAELVRESERDMAFAINSIKEQGKLEAHITRKGGKAAQKAGNIGAVGSIIGGISSVFG
jgi:hypothetical protein